MRVQFKDNHDLRSAILNAANQIHLLKVQEMKALNPALANTPDHVLLNVVRAQKKFKAK
jgi:hypothetical protein